MDTLDDSIGGEDRHDDRVRREPERPPSPEDRVCAQNWHEDCVCYEEPYGIGEEYRIDR